MQPRQTVRIVVGSWILLVVVLGCERPAARKPPRQRTVRRVVIVKKSRTGGTERTGIKPDSTPQGDASAEPIDDRPPPPANVPWRQGSGADGAGSPVEPEAWEEPAGVDARQAVAALFREIDDARSSAPTLVVWLIDVSPSARRWHTPVLEQIRTHYAAYGTNADESKASRNDKSDSKPLETAIGAFGPSLQWLVETPISDPAGVVQALRRLPDEESAEERPFAAVTDAIGKYLDERIKQRKELFIVLVTDEAGDDDTSLPEVVRTPRKYGIPIHVIGVPAPFGRRAVAGQEVEGGSESVPAPNEAVVVRRGPETWAVERIHLDFPDEVLVPAVIDSGFGPYGLESLAHETGGRFHAIESSSSGWPGGAARRFPRSVMQAYRPRFSARDKYDAFVSQNKALQALVQAARLPRAAVLTNPTVTFDKGDQPKLKVALDRAQRAAAKVELQIHRMYDVLWSGAAGRKKLKDPRWCASYDLAMGRIAAARARVDGYNAMLAALKRGVPSTDPNATQWVLEPAETTDVSSSLKGLVKRAREFLTRVRKEHPGTPWAYLAEQELQVPLGWKWTER